MKAIVLLLLLAGCATPERFLNAEEDAKMKEACADGCTVVPNAILLELLKRKQGVQI